MPEALLEAMEGAALGLLTLKLRAPPATVASDFNSSSRGPLDEEASRPVRGFAVPRSFIFEASDGFFLLALAIELSSVQTHARLIRVHVPVRRTSAQIVPPHARSGHLWRVFTIWVPSGGTEARGTIWVTSV